MKDIILAFTNVRNEKIIHSTDIVIIVNETQLGKTSKLMKE